MKPFLKLRWLLILPLLISCQDDEFDLSSLVSAKEFVRVNMEVNYLWNDEVPLNLNTNLYATPQDVLEAMRFRPIDRWSFVTENGQEVMDFFEQGRTSGYGMSVRWDPNDELRIALVDENSPAESAGIIRGMKVLSINGVTPDPESTIEFGETAIIEVQAPGESPRTILITPAEYDISTVIHNQVFEVDGTKIGYFYFRSFLETSEAELDQVFQDFSSQGIDELIVDVRYNSGGLIATAQYLGSYLVPDGNETEIFTQFLFNDNNTSENVSLFFENPLVDLNLDRVVFLTTVNSASASEMIINGLEPYMDVIQIGEASHGKFVGSSLLEHNEWLFAPITFRTANADGFSDFIDGLQPDFEVAEDLITELGNPDETLTLFAIDYLTGGLPTAKFRPTITSPVISPDPQYPIMFSK